MDIRTVPGRSAATPRLITEADLANGWRLEFEERAAIREYDAGQPRAIAEAEALREIVVRMRSAVRTAANAH